MSDLASALTDEQRLDAAAAFPAPARRPVREALAELLTVEARMDGLGRHAAKLREELLERAIETLAADGVAPTWRAPGLGRVVLRDPQPRVGVVDGAAFADWAAQNHATEATGVVKIAATDLEQSLEVLAAAGIVHKGDVVVELARPWQTAFIEGCHAEPDSLAAGVAWAGTVFAPETGEDVPGLALVPGGTKGISVTLDPEAKARARAELESPAALAMLTVDLGSLAASVALDPYEDVDDAEGEPDDLVLSDRAADAILGLAEVDAELRGIPLEAALETLTAEEAAPEPAGEVEVLVACSRDGAKPSMERLLAPGLAKMLVPELQARCRARGLDDKGRKAELVDRLAAYEASR